MPKWVNLLFSSYAEPPFAKARYRAFRYVTTEQEQVGILHKDAHRSGWWLEGLNTG